MLVSNKAEKPSGGYSKAGMVRVYPAEVINVVGEEWMDRMEERAEDTEEGEVTSQWWAEISGVLTRSASSE
jgi:hypothetical protein